MKICIFEWRHLETKKYCTIIDRLCYWSKKLTTSCNVRALKLRLWQSAMSRCRNLDTVAWSQPVSRPLACTDSLKYRDMLVVSLGSKRTTACSMHSGFVFIGLLVSRTSCPGGLEWMIHNQWLEDGWHKLYFSNYTTDHGWGSSVYSRLSREERRSDPIEWKKWSLLTSMHQNNFMEWYRVLACLAIIT